MSHDDHGHERGGHEIDKMPNRRLFNLLVGLSALTLAACFGVIQLFNLQVRGIEQERNARPSARLEKYRATQAGYRSSFGRVIFMDNDGYDPEPDTDHGPQLGMLNRMPIDDAKALVLKDPKKFAALKPYRGWRDPDKAKAGAAKPGATPAGAAGRGARRPAGARPAGARPAGARPGGARPAGARPAGARPMGARPPGARPAGAQPGVRPSGVRPMGARPAKPAPAKPAPR